MSLAYAYVADERVVGLFGACPKRDRDDLLRIFKSLADDPYCEGDYLQRSSGGRDLQVKRFGRWLITYWPDHAASELRIVDALKLTP